MVVEERVTSSSSGRKRRKYQTESNLDEKLGRREETNSECMFDADRRSAKKLANYLSMDLHEVDFCREYWQSVFSPFYGERGERLKRRTRACGVIERLSLGNC